MTDWAQVCFRASELPTTSAVALTRRLRANPEDIEARVELQQGFDKAGLASAARGGDTEEVAWGFHRRIFSQARGPRSTVTTAHLCRSS